MDDSNNQKFNSKFEIEGKQNIYIFLLKEDQFKKENINIKLSIRKNKLNSLLLSKRKVNDINIEKENEEELKKYIIDTIEINIKKEYIINNINKFNSSVNIIINLYIFKSLV